MTKRKTALQSAIEAIQDILNSRRANESNCDDYEFGLIECVKLLKSKLPQEKYELRKAFHEGISNGDNYGMDAAQEYFNQTFEI